MLTLFTTAKPFREHFAVIQRNALRSWTRLHPEVEIIVFGDDDGSADVCSELGLRHEPEVARNQFGAIRVDDLFARAQTLAKHDVICYVNCDIILMEDFIRAIATVRAERKEFYLSGERWCADIREPIDFSAATWSEHVRDLALEANSRSGVGCIDYFAFSRGLYTGIPPFGLGRLYWDQWLIWKAVDSGKIVVDASPVVLAVHQNHDYSHHPQGREGVWEGEEPKRNLELCGGLHHLRNLGDATHRLEPSGLKLNTDRLLWMLRRSKFGNLFLSKVFFPSWFFVLDVTRPLRAPLGLRSRRSDPSGQPGKVKNV